MLWQLASALLLRSGTAQSPGASGPVPNLPPDFTKQCSENCLGGPKVSPRSELAVYVFSQPGCKDTDAACDFQVQPFSPAPLIWASFSVGLGRIAATPYSHDACGWHYGGFCKAAPCECDNTKLGSGCVHGDNKSLLLPPGAHIKIYPQCNIIWSYPDLVVQEEHTNPTSDCTTRMLPSHAVFSAAFTHCTPAPGTFSDDFAPQGCAWS